MPKRSTSFTQRLAANGQALHRAMEARPAGSSAPTDEEKALAEDRRLLKEMRAERKAQASQPGPTALDKLVRTHRAERKDKPKATSDAGGEAKEVKKPKAKRTRAEKQAEKAAAIDAARAPKKAAK